MAGGVDDCSSPRGSEPEKGNCRPPRPLFRVCAGALSAASRREGALRLLLQPGGGTSGWRREGGAQERRGRGLGPEGCRVETEKKGLWPRTRESLGMGRVPIWPLWTIVLLMRPLGGLGPPLCPREPFYFLLAIMKMLGNKNDGTLYTPDDFSVCPAETLGCFRLELSVIGPEDPAPQLPGAREARRRGKKEENKIRPPLSSSRKGQSTAQVSSNLIPTP
nr:PREDICTED: uncharacterized protein LOC103558862 [Equus przewalskii]